MGILTQLFFSVSWMLWATTGLTGRSKTGRSIGDGLKCSGWLFHLLFTSCSRDWTCVFWLQMTWLWQHPCWSLCQYGCVQRMMNKNGVQKFFSKYFKLDTSFTNFKVGLLVFRVACHNTLEQFLPACLKHTHNKEIFSCAKASSECKLWFGILSSTQGRYLIVTIKEQEVTHVPFASPHPAPAGCRWFFPSPGGPSTLTFLSQPFGWDKAKSCYLGICEITDNQEMWGRFQSCQRSAMTPSRSLYLKSVPQMMKASFLSYWFVIKASHKYYRIRLLQQQNILHLDDPFVPRACVYYCHFHICSSLGEKAFCPLASSRIHFPLPYSPTLLFLNLNTFSKG